MQTSTDPKGVEITDVADGSPAAKAGLQDGDVITAIDGNDVTTADAVRSAVQAKSSGDEISVTYTRDGQSNTVKVDAHQPFAGTVELTLEHRRARPQSDCDRGGQPSSTWVTRAAMADRSDRVRVTCAKSG